MLGAAITIVGLLISWLVWRRRGAAAGLRGVAWSLVPLAAGLLGLMATLWRAVADIAGILAGLLFNPMVWAGVVVAGIAAVLFVASGFMRARGMGVRGAKAAGRSEAAGAGQAEGIAGPAPTAPQPKAGSGQKARKKAEPAGGDDDLGDIEDLLRKHGIE
ncbi:cellulose synthase [Nocardiopsis sp. CNT-189]|uniref:cellulose synthase n=1 Tax=Nocardiopsis oceanisediminis TaxID=2816862 RepID=UPI003B2DBF7C